mgnify:CR=1 FL=1
MKILITGGLGFIGSFFAEKLAIDNEKIIILDNFTGYSEMAKNHLEKIKNIEIHDVDITKKNIYKYFEGVDIVYHFAANSKISEGVNNPEIDFNISAYGTHNVLMGMLVNEVKRIVFSSGSGVYGDQNEVELFEDFGPLLPVSFYGASKLCAEAYISAFVGMKGMKAYIFRFANVVGYRQTHGVAYDFFHKLKNNSKELQVLGNGMQSKSYIDIGDIFAAIQLVVNKQKDNIDVYNIATTDYLTVREIAQITINKMGLENVNILYGDTNAGWVGDVPIIRFSTKKIRNLGWVNKYSSGEAIANAVEQLITYDNS